MLLSVNLNLPHSMYLLNSLLWGLSLLWGFKRVDILLIYIMLIIGYFILDIDILRIYYVNYETGDKIMDDEVRKVLLDMNDEANRFQRMASEAFRNNDFFSQSKFAGKCLFLRRRINSLIDEDRFVNVGGLL